MMLLRADKNTDAGVLPSHDALAAMAKYNLELIEADVLLDAAGPWTATRGSASK